MLNDIPKIDPMDKAVTNRLSYIEFPYVFVPEHKVDKKPYNNPIDYELDKKISDPAFIRGFLHIILDGYKKYRKHGMPKFDQDFKNKWTVDSKQNNEIIDLINEHFEITKDDKDRVEVAELKRFRDSNKNIFSSISVHRFNEILRDELGLTEGNGKTRFWKGIKKIQRNYDL